MNSVNFPAVNFYRFRKIAQDAVLVTLDSGEWQILSEEQFSDLKKENFEDKQFLNLLKDNHIYLTEDNWLPLKPTATSASRERTIPIGT